MKELEDTNLYMQLIKKIQVCTMCIPLFLSAHFIWRVEKWTGYGLPHTIPNKYDGLPSGYRPKSRATNACSPRWSFLSVVSTIGKNEQVWMEKVLGDLILYMTSL